MQHRFKGREGRRRLAEVLCNQELVQGDRTLAEHLSKAATIDDHEPGREIYVEGEPGKNCLYFVVAGSMDLLIHGQVIAVISAGQAFGEFPILNPALRYTVTIRVREHSTIARVSERSVLEIAQKRRAFWRNMAETLMRRLHGTRNLVSPAKRPCVFVGHGRSPLWKKVRTYLEHELSLVTVAYETRPRAGMPVVSVLEEMLGQATFAVLVMTAEDETGSGGMRARQNVVHEAGLFQGVLGFRRAILLLQRGVEAFSNVAGLEYLAFEGLAIEETFDDLKAVLVREEQYCSD